MECFIDTMKQGGGDTGTFERYRTIYELIRQTYQHIIVFQF